MASLVSLSNCNWLLCSYYLSFVLRVLLGSTCKVGLEGGCFRCNFGKGVAYDAVTTSYVWPGGPHTAGAALAPPSPCAADTRRCPLASTTLHNNLSTFTLHSSPYWFCPRYEIPPALWKAQTTLSTVDFDTNISLCSRTGRTILTTGRRTAAGETVPRLERARQVS